MSGLDPHYVNPEKEPENLLVDYMGLPLRRADVLLILEKAERHLNTPPRELAEYANKVIKNKHSAMLGKIEFTAEDYE